MKNIYKKYFQKSKIFLYPLLGIKKGITFVPNETYMSWDNLYTINDNKLILLYKISIDKLIDYNLFEENHLKKNKKYIGTINLKKTKTKIELVVIFNLNMFKVDINKLINGQYSKMSFKSKEIITKFFGENDKIAEYVESYLYPTYWHEDYAELLDVNINHIENVHELCDLPDLEKECFKYKIKNVKEFKKNFLSLSH